MDAWAVLNCLGTLPIPQDVDAAERIAFCRAAVEELQPRIREDADPNDPRLLRAAAGIACALCALRERAQTDDVSYFKAGDVTIHRSAVNHIAAAEKLREEGIRLALPLLRDDGFLFTAV